MIDKKLFIHLPKNAGMCIRKSPTLKNEIITATASRHISLEYTKALHETMARNGDHHGNEHARYRDIKQEVRDKYKAFAIIRNPWSRTVSRYMFARKVIFIEKKVDESYCDVSSFEAFLEERFKWGDKAFFWHRAVRGWFNQVDYVVDESLSISVDCLRFEYFRDDVAKYFKLPKFNDRARNVTGLIDDYTNIYTAKTIQIVADWYKNDIDTFGFDFNGSATRNIWK